MTDVGANIRQIENKGTGKLIGSVFGIDSTVEFLRQMHVTDLCMSELSNATKNVFHIRT